MILSLGTSTHCRLYFEASALFKPSFCKASGVGDRTFCEKYGVAKMTPTQTEQNRRRKEMLSTLLSKAVQKAQELPEAIQDELAEQFIEDIENEIKWQETLSKPQDSLILKELAQKAIADSENGQTEEMGFDQL